MSNRNLALLAFKVLGLWFLVVAVVGVASVPYVWRSAADGLQASAAPFLLLPSLVFLAIGLPLWFSTESFATRVFPDGQEGAQTTLQTDAMFALAASVIGLVLLSQGVPAMAGVAYLFGRSRETGVLGADAAREALLWDASAKARTIESIARVAIGVALLASPAKVAAGAERLRNALSRSRPDEGTPDQD